MLHLQAGTFVVMAYLKSLDSAATYMFCDWCELSEKI